MKRSDARLLAIFTTVGLDAAGIGLVFPIVPRLLEEVTHSHATAFYVGVMSALYALMQFVCAPTLGALSDRLGRRPVLLVSIAGAAINYCLMAAASSIPLLLLGRAIGGMTGANLSVATAYITDITPSENTAKRFGQFSAVFGAGFIIGPVIGGILGDHGVRMPFLVAALLNGVNLLLAIFLLPETRKAPQGRFDLSLLNPVRPLAWLGGHRGLLPVVGTYFLLSAAGEAYGSCWALWGFDVFGWSATGIGLSLGTYGICQTLVQAFLPGPATRWFGDRRTVLIGLGGVSAALAGMAAATQGWMVFAMMPLVAMAGLGTPAFQALAARKVDHDDQGQLQGVLASATSLASVFAPLGFSVFYMTFRKAWAGAVWLAVMAVYLSAIPLILISMRSADSQMASA